MIQIAPPHYCGMLLSESSDNLSGVASSRSVLWTWIMATDFVQF